MAKKHKHKRIKPGKKAHESVMLGKAAMVKGHAPLSVGNKQAYINPVYPDDDHAPIETDTIDGVKIDVVNQTDGYSGLPFNTGFRDPVYARTTSAPPHLEVMEREDAFTRAMLKKGGKDFQDFARKAAPGVFDADIDFLSVDDVKSKQAEQFTLIDKLHHFTYDPVGQLADPDYPKKLTKQLNKVLEPSMLRLRTQVRQARRFYLHDDFINEAVRKSSFQGPEAFTIADLARLPFESMWIEYDHWARVQAQIRNGSMHDRSPDPDGFGRSGFLFKRTKGGEGFTATYATAGPGDRVAVMPPLEMIFNLTEAAQANAKAERARLMAEASGMTKELATQYERLAHINWGWASKTDNGKLEPSSFEGVIDLCYPVHNSYMHGPLLRAGCYEPKRLLEQFSITCRENRGDPRFILAVLAMINIVPIKYTHTPAREAGTSYRGRNIPYLDHQIVSIEAGKQKIINVVNHAFKAAKEHARKRAHEVRGHFRVYYKGTPQERRTWIKEHQRGDASLGFVRQTWEVNAGKPA